MAFLAVEVERCVLVFSESSSRHLASEHWRGLNTVRAVPCVLGIILLFNIEVWNSMFRDARDTDMRKSTGFAVDRSPDMVQGA